MSSPQSTVRQRGGHSSKKDKPVNGQVMQKAEQLQSTVKAQASSLGSKAVSQWQYKVALMVVTGFGFLTRFWGIGHPTEVVFDEVHFGKVWQDIARAGGSRNGSFRS